MMDSPSTKTEAASGRATLHTAIRLASFLVVLAAVLLLLQGAFNLAGWASAKVQHLSYLPVFAGRSAFLYLHLMLLGVALIGFEHFMPGSNSPKRYLQAALFWAFYVPVAVASADVAHWIVQQFGMKPLFSVNYGDLKIEGLKDLAMNIGLIFLSAFCFDFFYYWFHRFQHTVPFFWAFHSSHHANQSLNALGCYHHPLEDVWRIPFFLLPMALAFEIVAPPLLLVSAFVTAWGLFNHMDSGFSLGHLRVVLADNHYHRLHHSMAKEHYNTNFAGMFAPWDRLFGTQVMPSPGAEKLPVGLDTTPHPQSVRKFLFGPFVELRQMLRDRSLRDAGAHRPP